MFPNMPDEVFNTWLLPIIRDHNTWPYLNVFSLHPSDQWQRYFRSFSINDFSNCKWNRKTLTFATDCLDPISNNTIDTLIRDHVYGFETPARNVRDSKSRFFTFVEFIQRTGTIPAPIIGINTRDGLGIIDGNHRLAALTHLGLRGCINCDTWLGHS
jgi:hypothetical protein